MDAALFDEQRAQLPPLPAEVTTDHFAANSQHQTDDSPPPTSVWKANGRANRAFRTQPPLRWRLYEVKAQRDLKMDLIWHPDFPQRRIARLRYVTASKSAAARTRHTRRREARTPQVACDNAMAARGADMDADPWGHIGSPTPLPTFEF